MRLAYQFQDQTVKGQGPLKVVQTGAITAWLDDTRIIP